MENVSIVLKIFFFTVMVLTVLQFYKATNYSKKFLITIGIWLPIQMVLGLANFYTNVEVLFPPFVFLIVPPLVMTIVIFSTIQGRKFIDTLDIKALTLLHTTRFFVEFVLYFLFIAGMVPKIMTFEGNNFDIVAGLTAPFIFYFYFIENRISKSVVILWNFVCLALLINIMPIALLSAKTPLQQFAFDQPNIAVTYFPFNLLPSVVVPTVLFSHLTSLRQLMMKPRKNI